ncbi:hypothetical protein SISSUDRAFT_994600 [Sistotremastrum suecicum HHB10207 ss-3]|uniref:Nudix hydrolase domain-containing protein n=1 Tax=Sistotremastrum suecicum HHB10207 ss-3 TaxID=1314776 RepID=A0A165X7H0_9AGAM|nr:hypothetical protein SISSUDRAFT_994600 [Sistotremastrum suecicum HHB10207 ss-3]
MRACQHEPLKLSELSSFTVPNSLFHAQDLQLGAGVVIIQPSTDNVVVLYSEKSKRYFLPKGRKDVGESIQDTAIREGYEESGYRCEPLPLIIHHNCPNPNANPLILCHNPPSTEAIAITMFHARPRRFRSRAPEPTGTEYLTFWYVAQIGPDAVMEQNTKMPDEVEYVTNLMSWDEAIQCLSRNGPESHLQVLKIAQMLWRQTQAVQARSRLPFRSLTIDTLSSAGASSGNSTPRSSWSFDKFRFPWKK